jgi:membrane carboxypeptidase/penicillin-binding protein PbpC
MMAAVERVRGSLPIDDYSPIATPTPDLRPVSLCALSGRAPNASCPTQITEWLPAGTKTGRCSWHTANGTVLPTEYADWTGVQGVSHSSTSAPAHLRTSAPEVLSISSPAAGSVFLYDPTLRAEFQSIALKARTSNAAGLKWFVNDVPLDVAGSGTPRWPLARGKHRITVRDARGNSATADVVVR